METSTAEQRFLAVAASAAIRWRRDPEFVVSHSNDTWLLDEPSRGPAVLRISWIGDRGRLITEAKVGRALPTSFGYPEVLGFGWTRDEADLTWSLTRRLHGCTLMAAWPHLTEGQRAEAVRTVAAKLAILHAWRPSAAISDRLQTWSDSSPEGIVGATINPLPFERLRKLVEQTDAPIDRTRTRRAIAWLEGHSQLAPELDRPGLPVTHGDVHLGQVWWDGRRVSGVLDLEWVRFAPAWTDLGRVADNVDTDAAESRTGHQELLTALWEPLGRGIDHLGDRLRYWRLACALRELSLRPPLSEDAPPDHPAYVIDALLE